jgi:CheY-like chemotaxis protein
MEVPHKILLLDDDPELLDMYREVLRQLPSCPEIHTATSGARAIALLEAEAFRLLICDLKMPKMDGLQVLSIVRRRFPELRTVVLTAVQDEEFRSRAYALGVDLFWLKPDTQQNMKMFIECLEALLGRDAEAGFRGIQSKSLMDIIQMEGISQSSTVLRVTRGALVGKIWLQNGELIDAEAEGARGEAAFRRILGWKSGTFESLPPEPQRERTINKSVNALLLETAQAIDEVAHPDPSDSVEQTDHRKTVWRLSLLTREGAEFVVSVPAAGQAVAEGWGTQSTEPVAAWVQRLGEAARRIGEHIEAGPLSFAEGRSLDRLVVVLPRKEKNYLVSWPPGTPADRLVDKTRQLVASWES